MEPGEMSIRTLRTIAPHSRCFSPRRLQRQSICAALALALFAAAWGGAGFAKDRTPKTRTVSGVVFDAANNTINGATVELADLQTGKVLDIYSQEDGSYQFTDVRFDHDYTVKAIYKNSESEARKVSMFETRWHLVLNLTILKPPK